MRADTLRVGLVGCGRLAEVGYLPALAQTEALDLVAVADPDPGRHERLAGLAGEAGLGPVTAFTDIEALLAGAEVDAVVLTNPVDAHGPDASAATEAGVGVLVEKPPARDAAGAAALAALAPAPHIGFNRRFDPAVRVLRAGLPTGGDVDLDLVVHYRRRSWGARTVRDDVLLDLGPHLVDWARWLSAGEVLAARAEHLSSERATVALELSRGRARLHAAADRLHREEITVSDGRGRLLARHRSGGPVAAVTGRLRPGPHPLVTSLAGQLDAFARTLAGRPDPDLGTAADGVATMAVLDAVRASADRGGHRQPVAVPTGS